MVSGVVKRTSLQGCDDAEHNLHQPVKKRRRASDDHTRIQPLTHEHLCRLNTGSEQYYYLSPIEMSPTERATDLSDVISLPPPSTRSTVRTRSSSPSRPTDAQYRTSNLFRATTYFDGVLPTNISQCLDQTLQRSLVDDARLSATADKLCNKSKELVRGAAGEAEWIEALQAAMEDLGYSAIKFVRNRGALSHLLSSLKLLRLDTYRLAQ